MEFKAWNAVHIIMKKGLHPNIIYSWYKMQEIPDKFVEMPDRIPNGGYMPLGKGPLACCLMAKPHEEAVLYDNFGKMYMMYGTYERIMAYYCLLSTKIDVEEVKAILREGGVDIDYSNDKLVRQLANNFKKSHPTYARKLTCETIPRLATKERPLLLCNRQGQWYEISYELEDDLIKRCWRAQLTIAPLMFAPVLKDDEDLLIRFCQCHGWTCTKESPSINPNRPEKRMFTLVLLIVSAPYIIQLFFYSLFTDEGIGCFIAGFLAVIWYYVLKAFHMVSYTGRYTAKDDNAEN